jgi:hypothetical protein
MKQNNRGQLTIRHGDLYSGPVAVMKGSSFVHSMQPEILVLLLIDSSDGIRQTDVVQKEFSV